MWSDHFLLLVVVHHSKQHHMRRSIRESGLVAFHQLREHKLLPSPAAASCLKPPGTSLCCSSLANMITSNHTNWQIPRYAPTVSPFVSAAWCVSRMSPVIFVMKCRRVAVDYIYYLLMRSGHVGTFSLSCELSWRPLSRERRSAPGSRPGRCFVLCVASAVQGV